MLSCRYRLHALVLAVILTTVTAAVPDVVKCNRGMLTEGVDNNSYQCISGQKETAAAFVCPRNKCTRGMGGNCYDTKNKDKKLETVTCRGPYDVGYTAVDDGRVSCKITDNVTIASCEFLFSVAQCTGCRAK